MAFGNDFEFLNRNDKEMNLLLVIKELEKGATSFHHGLPKQIILKVFIFINSEKVFKQK